MLAVMRYYEEIAAARRYTERANECRAIATTTHNRETRATLLNLADAWDIMAMKQATIADSRVSP